MKVEVLYFQGCPNHAPATELIREALRKEGKRADVLEVEVHTPEQAQSLGFLGSPSIRINGVDVEPEARLAKTFGFGCRTYFNENGRSGTPSETMVRRAINEQTVSSPIPAPSSSGVLPSASTKSGSSAGVLAAGGIAALLASTCCLGPLALLALGFSGAWIGNLTRLEPYRPYFIGAALVTLLFAARQIFRPAAACKPGEICALPQARRGYKTLFGVTIALVAVALLFPYIAKLFY